MPQRSDRWYWILLGLLVVLGLQHACQKDDPVRPEPAANVRIARLEVDRYQLGPDDSTRVRAWVVEGPEPGTPVPGAAVVYSEMPAIGGGTFSKTESTTDGTGWATTVFRASGNALGLVTLRAQVGTSIEYLLLEVQPATQDVTTLEVSTPDGQTGLPADGNRELEVSVSVTTGEARAPVVRLPLVIVGGDGFTDANGNGVHDRGEAIPADRDRDGDGVWDPEGSLPEQVITDDHGAARFRYRAGHMVGPVYVRITGAGVFREIAVRQHSLTLVVTLESETRELLADGVSQAAVMVRVQDWAQSPVSGIVLRCTAGEPFTDTNGNGFYDFPIEVFEDLTVNGYWDAIGSVASSVTTNSEGIAALTYTAGMDSGVVTIRATTTNGFGISTLRLIPVPPSHRLVVALDRAEIYADGAGSVGGSVTVTDANGGALAGKAITVVAGERFEDVNVDGTFTSGIDRLLDDADGNEAWTPAGTVTVHGPSGRDGRALFVLAAGRVPMQAWVHAAVDGVLSEAPLDLLVPPPVSLVTLDSEFAEMTVSSGGGVTRNPLTATCLTAESTPPPAGTRVSFRITAGPGGGERLENATAGQVDAVTNGDGKAEAVLLSGNRSGGVRVSATCSGGSGFLEVYLAPGGASLMTCAADSAQLAPGKESAVRAWVYDAAQNPVADGTPVRFRADEGMVRGSDGPAVSFTKDGVAVAIFTAVPTAGGDGVARMTVSTTSQAGGVVECISDIRVSGGTGTSCRVTIAPDSPEIAVRGTGTTEQTLLHARVFDCRGLPVRAGEPVAFVIAAGPGGGESFACCECDSVVIPTDETGTAEVNLRAGIRSGTVLVRARVLSSVGVAAHTPVAIAAGPPVFLSLGVENCNVLACITVADENPGTALVYDTYHNPVRDGTVVYFTTNYGMVRGRTELGSSTTERGFATFAWFTTGWPECGIVTITASTRGGGLVAGGSFIGSGPPFSARFVAPAADLVSLQADGETELPLRIEVLDFNGLYVLPADVELTAVYGEIGGIEKTDDGCNASIAKATYTAPVLGRDFSYTPADSSDDGIGGIDVVPVSAGFGPQGDLLQVQLLTGPASASKSVVDLATSMRPSDQSYFTITVKDAWGNPLGGHRLTIAATGGVITAEGVTDSYGVTGGLSFTAPAAPGTVQVEMRDIDPTRSGFMILRKSITIAE
jgi:hypothetical protein